MGIHILVAHVDRDGGNARLDVVADGHGHQFAVRAARTDAVDKEAVAAFRRQNGAGGILHRNFDVAQGLGRGIGDGKAKRELAVCHDRLIAAKTVVGDHQDRIGNAFAAGGRRVFQVNGELRGIIVILAVLVVVAQRHVDVGDIFIRILDRLHGDGLRDGLPGLHGFQIDQFAGGRSDSAAGIGNGDRDILCCLRFARILKGQIQIEIRTLLDGTGAAADLVADQCDDRDAGVFFGFFLADQRDVDGFRHIRINSLCLPFLALLGRQRTKADHEGITAILDAGIDQDRILNADRIADVKAAYVSGKSAGLDRHAFFHGNRYFTVGIVLVASVIQRKRNVIDLARYKMIVLLQRIGHFHCRSIQRGVTILVFCDGYKQILCSQDLIGILRVNRLQDQIIVADFGLSCDTQRHRVLSVSGHRPALAIGHGDVAVRAFQNQFIFRVRRSLRLYVYVSGRALHNEQYVGSAQLNTICPEHRCRGHPRQQNGQQKNG